MNIDLLWSTILDIQKVLSKWVCILQMSMYLHKYTHNMSLSLVSVHDLKN